jgi:ABC-2 type transport system permease protein
MNRIAALVGKDLVDLKRHPGLFWPAGLTAAIALVLPFVVAIMIPRLTGELLSDSSDFQIAAEMYGSQPGARDLDPEGAIQAWILQQFLPLLVLAPVAGSMAIAAASVVGEKQARTLEPLLATPITTFELLAAKVLGALLPSIALTVVCFAAYVGLTAAVARPGVFWMLLGSRSLAVAFVLGPLAALAALQLAVCVSSRTNDARSAQQIGALVILPLGGVLVAQLTGSFTLTVPVTLSIAAALLLFDALLMWIGIVLFDRESILTRWK